MVSSVSRGMYILHIVPRGETNVPVDASSRFESKLNACLTFVLFGRGGRESASDHNPMRVGEMRSAESNASYPE